jgi:hypothetical protein
VDSQLDQNAIVRRIGAEYSQRHWGLCWGAEIMVGAKWAFGMIAGCLLSSACLAQLPGNDGRLISQPILPRFKLLQSPTAEFKVSGVPSGRAADFGSPLAVANNNVRAEKKSTFDWGIVSGGLGFIQRF